MKKNFQYSQKYADAFLYDNNKEHCCIFVHGFSDSHISWDDIIKKVAPYTDAISYDCTGHGNNSHLWEIASFDEYVTQLKELISSLTKYKKITVIGHSQGSSIAAQCLINNNDLFDQLILVSPFFYIDRPLKILWNHFIDLISKNDLKTFFKINSALLIGKKADLWIQKRDLSIEERMVFFKKDHIEKLAKALLEVNVQGDYNILNKKIKTMIHGEFDLMFPITYSRELASFFPLAQFIPVKDANHLQVELEPYISDSIISLTGSLFK